MRDFRQQLTDKLYDAMQVWDYDGFPDRELAEMLAGVTMVELRGEGGPPKDGVVNVYDQLFRSIENLTRHTAFITSGPHGNAETTRTKQLEYRAHVDAVRANAKDCFRVFGSEADKLLRALVYYLERARVGHNDGGEPLQVAIREFTAFIRGNPDFEQEPVGYRCRHRDWSEGVPWSFLDQDSHTAQTLMQDDDWEVQPVYV